MSAQVKPLVLYVYDAMCGWCYGFDPVIKKASEVFADDFNFVAVSGGMITGDRITPIAAMSDFILKAYHRVEETTGIKFGEGYLNLVKEGSYLTNSIKPGIAMSVFKSYHPERSIDFACDLQHAHMFEGKDLNGREVYMELIKKYAIEENGFIEKLNSEQFQQQTYAEFKEVQRIGITGFPAVLLQYNDGIYLISNGYVDYEELAKRLIAASDALKNAASEN